MSNVPAKHDEEQLQALATEIQEHVDQCEKFARTTLEHARAIGERLVAAKGLVKRGQWQSWVEANLRFSMDTAERMMRLHRQWDCLNSAPVQILGVKDAIAYLTAEKKKAKQNNQAAGGHETKREAKANPRPDRTGDLAAAGVAEDEAATASDEAPEVEANDEPQSFHERLADTVEAELSEPEESLDGDEFVVFVNEGTEDHAADELLSGRDCYLDSGEADFFCSDRPFEDDAIEDLEVMLSDMSRLLARMLDHDAIESLSDFDPLKTDLCRLQRAVEQVATALDRKRPVACVA